MNLPIEPPDNPEPVTAVFSRRAKPGQEAALEAILDRIVSLMKRSAGFQGVAVMRPQPGHPPIFTMVATFASQPDLDTWTSNEARGRLIAEADEISIGGLHVQQATGLEAWFQMPGQPIVVPPPRYKMAVITWLAILPLLIIINVAAGPLLAHLPPIARPVPVTVVLIPLMTWAVMPQMTKVFRPWLYPTSRRRPQE
ncbi:MAG TPA: antibiotic biosynthesis monooxygenase [Patescibacteria group bacterium]|nr:antibiotic biosynthesis monooxygenase [Patescibacteria group bacterium]